MMTLSNLFSNLPNKKNANFLSFEKTLLNSTLMKASPFKVDLSKVTQSKLWKETYTLMICDY